MYPATLPFKLRASSGPQFHRTFEGQQGCRSHLVLVLGCSSSEKPLPGCGHQGCAGPSVVIA